MALVHRDGKIKTRRVDITITSNKKFPIPYNPNGVALDECWQISTRSNKVNS